MEQQRERLAASEAAEVAEAMRQYEFDDDEEEDLGGWEDEDEFDDLEDGEIVHPLPQHPSKSSDFHTIDLSSGSDDDDEVKKVPVKQKK